jgi:aspartyl-tRNA(Asn)/glutamyl-tRNA(Gln) amidotransferase subunit C
MALDRDTVRRIARLARIRVPDGELDGLAGELGHILGWIEQLNEVDTSGVEPMISVVAMRLRWRDDAVVDGGCRDKVLANATDPAEDQYFTVPKVVE